MTSSYWPRAAAPEDHHDDDPHDDPNDHDHDPEPTLHLVTLWLCSLCLDGAGGECHTPGCALWINRAPDLPLRNAVESIDGAEIVYLIPDGGAK